MHESTTNLLRCSLASTLSATAVPEEQAAYLRSEGLIGVLTNDCRCISCCSRDMHMIVSLAYTKQLAYVPESKRLCTKADT